MKVNPVAVRKCLKSFDFETLFREHLGWEQHHAGLTIPVGEQKFELNAVAQKRGFVAYVCDGLPDRAVRLLIDHQVTKSVREHFVIYCDRATGVQVWHWVRRQPGRPSASRDHRFEVSQSGDRLIQRLDRIAVTLDEEEQFTLTAATEAVASAFDVDRVTKRFFDQFKTEHAAFLKFIKGIADQGDLEWYTSLMLNRLMFVYFIQKKGFLDGDTDYLRNRLRLVRESRGKDEFHSFYRYFLLRLFHEGLGQAGNERKLDRAMEQLLGKVPYLNGGFFEVHQLEERNREIDIPDKAFEKLFDFFDRFSWHLDERELRADNEINPDVVGYIFEKYINQKQMGAYYTKEDITEYICKNTIIPFLFDAAEKACPIAFQKGAFIWRLLMNEPDRYIYEAMRTGVIDDNGTVVPLPGDIERGVADVARREGWNRPAPAPFALPTETWREHIARRSRCLELRQKLRDGEVQSINDLVTLNLDLWQFARDAITNAEGPEVVRAFWGAIERITVLDPTCGSGAFLFAALRVLETLYSDCLGCMERFVDEHAASSKPSDQFSDFRKVLTQLDEHPNEKYFIFKSIIIGNLYGVDIMAEAVEICKLRLFLKLVAQVESVGQIEPLPDIDFNIRCGNALVGYATKQEARKAFTEGATGQRKLMLDNADEAYERFEESAEVVDRAFKQFRRQQTIAPEMITAANKRSLREALRPLQDELDRFLAADYRVGVRKKNAFKDWVTSHQPFHWFVEFYGIMRGGGFDVVVGNPPWAEYAAVKKRYSVIGYETQNCGNLHALCTERALRLRKHDGVLSFIVQLPLASSSRMQAARQTLVQSSERLWVLTFDDRPAKLFEGLQHCRAVIFVSKGRSSSLGEEQMFVTRYHRWPSVSRSQLFGCIRFTRLSPGADAYGQFPKIASDLGRSVLRKVQGEQRQVLGTLVSRQSTKFRVFYQEATQYWVKATVGAPYYSRNGAVGAPAHGRSVALSDLRSAQVVAAVMNSSVFYQFFLAYSDCFHLSDSLVATFPLPSALESDRTLSALGNKLDREVRETATRKTIRTKDGDTIAYDEFVNGKSKATIDDIDARLAAVYGFTDEELDFIINYDVKYRVGAEEADDQEDG